MENIQKLRSKNIKNNEKRQKEELLKQKLKSKKLIEKELKNQQFAKSYSAKKVDKIDQLIKKVNEKYNDRISKLNREALQIPESQTKLEEEKLKNDIFIKYYSFKINSIRKSFEKKTNRILKNAQIAKITEEDASQKINKLRIDEGAAYERWDIALLNRKSNTSLQKIKNKINKLKTLNAKEVSALEKRKKTTPPNNIFKSIRDKIDNFESRAIFGWEIREVISKISTHVRRYSMFYVLIVIICIFAITTKGLNLKSETFMNIISNNTYILIIGLGMLLVIVGGYIDLSVGSMLGFVGALSVIIYNMLDNVILTVILIILISSAMGFVQGFLIGYLKMPSFIVTLGTMLLFQGLILTITKSMTLAPNIDLNTGESPYINFITGFMPDISIGSFHIFGFSIVLIVGIISIILMVIGRNKKAKYGLSTDSTLSFYLKLLFLIALFSVIGYYVGSSLFGLQYYLIYIIVLVALFIFITQNTSFGRKIYAIGGNKKAAILSGINASRITVYIFTINGLLVGLASIVFTAIITQASPTVSTAGYELDVISSVFVGGASMSGGIGTIAGTFIGGLILGYINNGMALMNLQADMQKIIKAIVLLSAVGYDIYSNRKQG